MFGFFVMSNADSSTKISQSSSKQEFRPLDQIISMWNLRRAFELSWLSSLGPT